MKKSEQRLYLGDPVESFGASCLSSFASLTSQLVSIVFELIVEGRKEASKTHSWESLIHRWIDFDPLFRSMYFNVTDGSGGTETEWWLRLAWRNPCRQYLFSFRWILRYLWSTKTLKQTFICNYLLLIARWSLARSSWLIHKSLDLFWPMTTIRNEMMSQQAPEHHNQVIMIWYKHPDMMHRTSVPIPLYIHKPETKKTKMKMKMKMRRSLVRYV